MERFHFLLGDYPVTRPFLEAPRLPDGEVVQMRDFAESGGARPAMSRMLQELPGLHYDICELPLANYISARELGGRYTALPVVACRRFEHGGIWGDERQGIREPRNLEGKRVGIIYHGHSDLVWQRGILSDVYGVDIDSITWITTNAETVGNATLPPNVWQIPGCKFPALIDSGVIAGAVLPATERFDNPAVRRLVPDVAAAERDWFATTGIFPPVHTVVVKDAVLAARPDLAGKLCRALSAAKAEALARAGRGMTDAEIAERLSSGFLVAPEDRSDRPYLPYDPLPYGVAANRTAFAMFVRFMREQKIIATEPSVDELFVAVDEPETA